MLDSLRQAIIDEGFVLVGVAPAVNSTGFSDLLRWIESGYAGEMSYLHDRLEAYRHPDGVMTGTKSIIVMAFPYASSDFESHRPGCGKVARYAWAGDDYHDTLHAKLKRLRRCFDQCYPDSATRGIVDTAPLMERELAQLAGLGWRGKNTLLLNKRLGSYFFLACLLTDVELPTDSTHQGSHCGTCTSCLDQCPTDAFVGPGVLDASRCISYLTIEHRGHIDAELRPGMGDWVFGCDVCQEVCPWNQKAKRATTEHRAGPLDTLDLVELFALDEDQFRSRFRRTPLWRTRRRGILRNAAIALGNQRRTEAVGALLRGLVDSEAIVRAASAWALGQIGDHQALGPLQGRLDTESDPIVRSEIEQACRMIGQPSQ